LFLASTDKRCFSKDEVDMNRQLLRVLLVAACSVTAVTSYAQSSDAMSAPATSAAPSSKQADRALAKAVRRALGKAQGFDVSGVFVRARSGAVTLSGTVKSGEQIQQAEEVTRKVQGVTSVSNKLSLFHGGNG
jgi:hyperosmotically inducible protein